MIPTILTLTAVATLSAFVAGAFAELYDDRPYTALASIAIACALIVAVMLTGCQHVTLPDLTITAADVEGSASIAGTVGAIPFSLDASPTEVCVTILGMTRCAYAF
jgi:hypothetical protein